MTARSAVPTCEFCASVQSDVELLFRSSMGGIRPFICSDCVEGFGEVLRLHRKDPALSARYVAQHNAAMGKRQ